MASTKRGDTQLLSPKDCAYDQRPSQRGNLDGAPLNTRCPPSNRSSRPFSGNPSSSISDAKTRELTKRAQKDEKPSRAATDAGTKTSFSHKRMSTSTARVSPSRRCQIQISQNPSSSTWTPGSSRGTVNPSHIDTTWGLPQSKVSAPALVAAEAGSDIRRSPNSQLSQHHLPITPNPFRYQSFNSKALSTERAFAQNTSVVTMNRVWPQPCPVREEWKTYTFVDLFVSRLPADVTTKDIYQNFSQYGKISRIRINIASDGTKGRSATVMFKPPPKSAFWPNHRFPFSYGEHHSTEVFVKLSDRAPRSFTVPSPVRKNVDYHDEMELEAQSIDFGVLVGPTSMMIMRTRQSENSFKVKLVLNLKKREIWVCFPSYLESANRKAIREYRFKVSFDQAFSISQVQKDSRCSFVLDVLTPPPYYKKLNEHVLTTHDPESTLWLEKDSWLRQTDIVNHKDDFVRILQTPIDLKKSIYSINIGRWTTYRISFDQATLLGDELRIFVDTLRDFNIIIKREESFEFVRSRPPIWNVLDRHLESSSATKQTQHFKDLSLEEELNRIYLPFAIRYQLEVCISNGWLNEYNLDEAFLRRLSVHDERDALHRLERVADLRKRFFEPQEIFNIHVPVLRQWHQRVPEHCIIVYSATVTATTILFHSPQIEMTNRVMRQFREYANRFLRIRFEDDEYQGNTKIHSTTTREMNEVFTRVRRTLMQGIRLGERQYEFLAYGNSQLREHGAYFFAKVPGVLSASQIRAWMGQFDHEKIVAKHAARIGQCFSTTRDIKGVRVPRVHREGLIQDVERRGYTFTDGVGKISPLLAEMASQQLKLAGRTPSVFQFRLGGCKGVLAVAPDLQGLSLKIRESQFKFPSESSNLEIIRWSETWQAKLNRQIIIVMSALGVKNKIFLDMQDRQIKLLAKAMEDDDAAHQGLTHQVDPNHMTLVIDEMVSAGFRAINEPFVTSLLRLWRAWSIKYMKEKAQLPVEKSACILGCIDETSKLQGHFNHLNASVLEPSNDHIQRKTQYRNAIQNLPQVFVQVWVQNADRTGYYEVIKGLCVIARNPSLHKGDLRVVLAVDIPELHHLRDVLVLPQTGDRDLSSMCSGGDLDGDDYVVIWDETLIPEIWNVEPMDYTPPIPVKVEGDVTQNDIVKFYHQYMKNDFLGKIAHAHLAWADHIEGDSLNSEQCLELVDLHSKAVDYPKTGVPAHLPRRLEQHPWPHFMEKRSEKRYKSRNILGQLYDAVELVAFVPNYESSFDARILDACNPDEHIMHNMLDMKHDYDSSLQRIMAQHQIKTEFEVWSTFCLAHSKASSDFKFHEQAGELSHTLRDRYLQGIVELAGGKDTPRLKPYAVAAYRIVKMEVAAALEEVKAGKRPKDNMPFISFPWVMQKTMCDLARGRNLINYNNKMLFDTTKNRTMPLWEDFLGEHYDDPAPLEDVEEVDSSGDNAIENQNGSKLESRAGNILREIVQMDKPHGRAATPDACLSPKENNQIWDLGNPTEGTARNQGEEHVDSASNHDQKLEGRRVVVSVEDEDEGVEMFSDPASDDDQGRGSELSGEPASDVDRDEGWEIYGDPASD